MKISIVLQFENAKRDVANWAIEERGINFYQEHERATRCTVAYAAMELKAHLEKCLEEAYVEIDDKVNGEAFPIRLVARDYTVRGEEYSLIPEENGMRIEGKGRVGVLYGVYEFLKMQGWRWYSPGDMGTYAPKKKAQLTLPLKKQTYETAAKVGRGFSIDGRLNENEELFVWMARNRLNVFFNFPNTCRFMQKLGFILRDGGHIFERILHPDRVMPSGKTLWEEHEDWFGMPANWEKTKEKAQLTQFCVSQPDCLDFLCEDLLEHTMDEWHEAEEINVWGFDTWGGICSCENCKKLGNATDQTVYMASKFRDYLNGARKEGRLDRDIRMVLCAYEGQDSIRAPQNPIPQNLIDAGDHWLYAPIVRCYAHPFHDAACSYNQEYHEALQSWDRVKPNMPMSILEYYNLSRFEDLPLLFIRTMKKDFLYFKEKGIGGFCYMHIPMVNWGVRALTQVLFAELAWNADVDTEAIMEEYFQHRYGQHADEMRKIYHLIDEASAGISSWRNFKNRSLLGNLLAWDGGIPKEPLPIDDHFETPRQLEEMGKRTETLWEEALHALEEAVISEKNNPEASFADLSKAVNPEQLRRAQNGAKVLKALLEDKRGLIYGVDSHKLLFRMWQYYHALYRKDAAREEMLWADIERLEKKLEEYYMPITFDFTYMGVISKSALERTQLQDMVWKCRQARMTRMKREKGAYLRPSGNA